MMSSEPKLPKIGSQWKHKNGITYEVLFLTNTENHNDKYPVTVVYQTLANGNKWSRPLSQWYASMKEVI
jgi:hypothetical protein